jgi:uroporphyrin-III C-methyltransferase
MGLGKIREIMDIFSEFQKSEMPVAVIQDGTLDNQRCVVGTVSSISSIVENENISSPAIIVVGEVVKYSNEIEKMISKHIGRG